MMAEYIIKMSNGDELYHHGIIGQKWGIRRYQNKDGTLTAEGKKRYSDLSDEELRKRINRMSKEKQYIELAYRDRVGSDSDKVKGYANDASLIVKGLKPKKDISEVAGRTANAVKKSSALVKDTDKLIWDLKKEERYKEASKIEDKDLEAFVKRMDLEKQYSNLKKDRKIEADEIIKDASRITIDAIALTSSAMLLYKMLKK